MRTLLTIVVVLATLASHLPVVQAAPKPNFILILADDMGYGDIAPFGSVKNRTPNLDRMAREGLALQTCTKDGACGA